MTRNKNLPKADDGRTLYPCCGAQKNSHKLLYWKDVSFNRWYDDPSEENWKEKEKWQYIYCESYTYCIDGMMYFPFPEFNEVKEAVTAYDLCH